MSEFDMCAEGSYGWCLHHPGRRFSTCMSIARARAGEQARRDLELQELHERVILERIAREHLQTVCRNQDERARTIERFVSDARAIISHSPKPGTPMSQQHPLGLSTCVGAQYGICVRDPAKPWMLQFVNRLAQAGDKKIKFIFCNNCAAILESNGIATKRFECRNSVNATTP